MGKINISLIIRDHFSTLRNNRSGKLSTSDFLLFIGTPVILGMLCWWANFNFDTVILNGMLAAFSIFAGLLLNLLVLVCTFAGNPRFIGSDAATVTRRRTILEVHENLSFSILISIAVVVVALVGLCEIKYVEAKVSHPAVSITL